MSNNVTYLDGKEIAKTLLEDAVIPTNVLGEDRLPAMLEVKGSGPFRDQIERLAPEVNVVVVDLDDGHFVPELDLDITAPDLTDGFFTNSQNNLLTQVPCVVEGIYHILRYHKLLNEPITVLGRGRYGTFTATMLARKLGKVTWQGSHYEITDPGVFINCSRYRSKAFPDGSTVIDIHDLGQLTTAILLSRTLFLGGGQINIL